MFDDYDLRPISLLDEYRAALEDAGGLNAPEAPYSELDDLMGGGGGSSQLAEDDVRYFASIGLPYAHAKAAGWVSSGDGKLLVPATGPHGQVLAVRALDVVSSWDELDMSPPRVSADQRWIEADPTLPFNDVPIPLHPDLFDSDFTWVSFDPMDALFLRSVGINATSLTEPHATLGSAEGLWELADLGVINARRVGKGTLVIVDPNRRATPQQLGILKGQFKHVWEAYEAHTGRSFYEWITSARGDGFPVGGNPAAGGVKEFLLNVLAGDFEPSSAVPVALPPRPSAGHEQPNRQPITSSPVADLADAAAKGPDWIVEGFIPAASLTQFHGIPKHGKSTLLLSMLAEVSTGGSFLGRPCRKSPVLYLTEETANVFAVTLSRSLPPATRLESLPDFHSVTLENYFGREWRDILSWTRTECKRLGARVVVFDTLPKLSRRTENAMNSDGEVRELFGALRGLIVDGVSVVTVLHSRKGNGSIIETIGGSVAIPGEADHIVRVRRDGLSEFVRRVDTMGRISSDADMYLEKTPTGWVPLPGRPSGIKSETVRSAPAGDALQRLVYEVLERNGGWLVVDEIRKAVPDVQKKGEAAPASKAMSEALAALVENKKVEEEQRQTGKPGRPPMQYRIKHFPSPPL